MKAFRLQKEEVALRDVPAPSPGSEAKIRLGMAGICRTDIELAKGYMGFEGTLGHEFVGTVADSTGEIPVGTRVVGEINCGCGDCYWCQSGLERHCPNRTVLGIQDRHGCFSEEFLLPSCNLVPVPDSVPNERAVFAEPLAAVLEIFEQVLIRPLDSVAVVGDGKLGLLIALVFSLRHTGSVLLVGHHPSNWRRFPEISALHEEDLDTQKALSFDVVVEASGTSSGLLQAMGLTKPRGTIVLKSTMEKAEPINMTPAVVNEIAVVGSRCGRLPAAIRFLEQTQAPVEKLIEAVYPLHEAERAWDHACEKGTLKVCLKAHKNQE